MTNADKREEIRARHERHPDGDFCANCKKNWPCDATRLLRQLDDASKLIEYVDHTHACELTTAVRIHRSRPNECTCGLADLLRKRQALAQENGDD